VSSVQAMEGSQMPKTNEKSIEPNRFTMDMDHVTSRQTEDTTRDIEDMNELKAYYTNKYPTDSYQIYLQRKKEYDKEKIEIMSKELHAFIQSMRNQYMRDRGAIGRVFMQSDKYFTNEVDDMVTACTKAGVKHWKSNTQQMFYRDSRNRLQSKHAPVLWDSPEEIMSRCRETIESRPQLGGLVFEDQDFTLPNLKTFLYNQLNEEERGVVRTMMQKNWSLDQVRAFVTGLYEDRNDVISFVQLEPNKSKDDFYEKYGEILYPEKFND